MGKRIDTDWYRDTLAADIQDMGMPETAKDFVTLANHIDGQAEEILELAVDLNESRNESDRLKVERDGLHSRIFDMAVQLNELRADNARLKRATLNGSEITLRVTKTEATDIHTALVMRSCKFQSESLKQSTVDLADSCLTSADGYMKLARDVDAQTDRQTAEADPDEPREIRSDDLIALIQRRQARALDSRSNNLANELGYILGRCTGHAQRIRTLSPTQD